MKKLILIPSLVLACQLAFALPSIDFPVKHIEVPAYPGQASFVVNGANGVPNNVPFKLQCNFYNPNDYQLDIKFDPSSRNMCADGALDCRLAVNGKINMMSYPIATIESGNNVIEVSTLKATSVNSSVSFQNYSNDGLFIIENCKAILN